jgi:hypothetical protein
MLSFLDFEGCKFLTEVPSLSRVPNLGALCLDYCTNLIRIHDSVGFLDRLVLISAQGCTQLDRLVPSINLPSAEIGLNKEKNIYEIKVGTMSV